MEMMQEIMGFLMFECFFVVNLVTTCISAYSKSGVHDTKSTSEKMSWK